MTDSRATPADALLATGASPGSGISAWESVNLWWLARKHKRLISFGALIGFWAISRAIMRWLWATRFSYIVNDVLYYHYSLQKPDAEALVEYPTPILWLLRACDFLASGDTMVFQGLLIGALALLDLCGALLLAHFISFKAGWYWCLYLALVGPLIWFRLDLFPAFFVMLALLCATIGRDTLAGAALALAAAAKFWPALLVGALIGFKGRLALRARAFVVVGGAIGVVSLLANGWDRSVSPLTWQSERGLQIESVLATQPMYRHALPGLGYKIIYSQFNAYEVVGPDVDMWLRGADVAFVAAIVLSFGLFASQLRSCWQLRDLLSCFPEPAAQSESGTLGADQTSTSGQVWHRTHFAQAGIVLAVITVLIVANKTYSPQYMMWLAGPAAILLGSARDAFEWATAGILGGLCLVSAWLTQMIYPFHYLGLIYTDLGDMTDTMRLVIRNLLMLFVSLTAVVLAGWSSWRVREGVMGQDD